MKKRVNKIPLVIASLLTLSACAGGSDWNQVGTSDTINYCLLIGQIDHNDSSARTAGIREELGTRDLDHKRSNPNTENPIVNENFYVSKTKGRTYRIVEKEHGEQKSTSGATWDQQTANETATLWINKHYANSWTGFDGKKKNGQSISFFVSNNDGMAMGALGSVRWIKDMPIFGYDCNDDAVAAIKEGRFTGTVDQSGTGQAAAIYMVARNIIDHKGQADYTLEKATTEGFGKENANNYGYVGSDFLGLDGNNAKLCRNKKVTSENIDDFYNKTIQEKLAKNEAIQHYEQSTKNKIYHSYYSSTDNFLCSTMKPLFEELAPTFNFDAQVDSGNGNDEALSMNNLETALAKGKGYFDAFIINMVKTTSTQTYLNKIYDTYNENGIVNVPIIFWNRQPTTETNEVDTKSMTDKRFKYIVYVGFDAAEGGHVQGNMIREYLENKIEEMEQKE